MAGRGPAPKDPAQRRNRNQKQRGEWIDLPHLEGPILPDLPHGNWSDRTRAMWDGWRQDPATTQYGPGTIALAVQLAYLFEDYVRGNEKFSEVRLVMDGLGLTEKGKRDLRWRVSPDAEVVDLPRESAAERMEKLRKRAASSASAP